MHRPMPRTTRSTRSPRGRLAGTVAATLAAALLGLGLPAGAQATSVGSETEAPQSLDRAERRFIEQAAADGVAEVELGQLAQQRATHPRVREFAARLVKDQSALNTGLMRLATDKGMAVPADAGLANKREIERLSGLEGGEFDRAYMQRVVEEHQKDLREFEQVADAARDADLKVFTAGTVPLLQSHLEQARATQDALKEAR